MPRRSTIAIGRAGEHYVAAEINRRGGYASPFAGNVPGIDVVASNSGTTRTIYIQVKTKRPGSNWQVDISKGWATIRPAGCPGDGSCKGRDPLCTPLLTDCIPGETDRFWVFVSLQQNGGQRYFIVPDDYVRGTLVRTFHQVYLAENGGQRPGKKHDSLHHAFGDQHLSDFEDKWDALGLGLTL